MDTAEYPSVIKGHCMFCGMTDFYQSHDNWYTCINCKEEELLEWLTVIPQPKEEPEQEPIHSRRFPYERSESFFRDVYYTQL